jgi:cbb3-type cytochrome oxidase cytochrome c subunit
MRFLLFIPVVFLLSCGSVEKREVVQAEHEANMKIPAIDDMIVKDKKEYIERCYMPVYKKIASNSPRPCETSLQQLLERRFYANYSQEHVDMAADELFFKDIKEKLSVKVRTEPKLRKALGKRFKNMDEVMDYYKSKYTFRVEKSEKSEN